MFLHQDRYEVLFPHYLFVRFCTHSDRWQSVNGTRGVKCLLGTPDPIPLPDGMAERFSSPVDITDLKAIVAGSIVQVINGPFYGLIGEVDSITPDDRVILLMTMIGSQRSVPVPASFVERLR